MELPEYTAALRYRYEYQRPSDPKYDYIRIFHDAHLAHVNKMLNFKREAW